MTVDKIRNLGDEYRPRREDLVSLKATVADLVCLARAIPKVHTEPGVSGACERFVRAVDDVLARYVLSLTFGGLNSVGGYARSVCKEVGWDRVERVESAARKLLGPTIDEAIASRRATRDAAAAGRLIPA